MLALFCFATHICVPAAELVSPASNLHAETAYETNAETTELISRLSTGDMALSGIIKKKQRFYTDTFPELEFVVMEGGEEWADDMETLSVLLGYEPVSLDYKHPPDAREDLMYVSLERVRMMLDSNAPSASLFLADKPLGWRDKLCIITINPTEIATNDSIATHYLIEPYYEIRGKIKQENFLDRKEFIEFVFDHEVYHCLESNYIGPQPMSYLEFWGEYYHYRHENGADAFAIAMHIKRHGAVTEFVNNMILIRGLSLYCDDCNHWTPETIQQASNIDVNTLELMDTMGLFKYASSIRDTITPSYKDYLVYRSTAKEVCGILNSNFLNTDEEGSLPPPDPTLIESMLEVFRNSYHELTGMEFPGELTR